MHLTHPILAAFHGLHSSAGLILGVGLIALLACLFFRVVDAGSSK
jgi:hypothetical protein